VAQWMALDAPERVASLVLVGSTPGDAHGPARQKQVSRALAGGDAEQMGPLFFTGQFLTAHPDVARDFFAREASVTARRVHFQASTGHDAWEELPRIIAPTLVVHGDEDPVNLPAHGRLLAERIPGAELLELAGQRHCPHLESEDCTGAVLEFVGRVG
jgi:pimeloyl-ACP methyl ester carboxylesterase